MHADSKPKKQSKLMKPLKLNKETLRQLSDASSLEAVEGAGKAATVPCTSMNPVMCMTLEAC